MANGDFGRIEEKAVVICIFLEVLRKSTVNFESETWEIYTNIHRESLTYGTRRIFPNDFSFPLDGQNVGVWHKTSVVRIPHWAVDPLWCPLLHLHCHHICGGNMEILWVLPSKIWSHNFTLARWAEVRMVKNHSWRYRPQQNITVWPSEIAER